MALMTSIRDNMTKLFAVLAVFFILFIIFDWGMDLTGRRGQGNSGEAIGIIEGKEVTYREFAELVRRMAENQKKQTGQEVDEDTERQIRSQVWNQLVDQHLVEQEMDRLGIQVTDQEVLDIVQGPNPPEFLVQQFRDSTGTFRRDAYVRAMSDPQNREAWIQVEDAVRQEQRQRKLQNLLFSSVRASEDEVLRRFFDRNATFDADYALFDLNRAVPDSSAQVTDADIRRYYDSHPEEFKAKAARRVKYVFFNQAPSGDDTANVEKEMAALLEQATSGMMDFAELAKTYSETPQSDAFFKHGELGRNKENAVFSAKKGEIVGPIRDFDGIHLIKVLDERQGTAEFVKASHILINFIPGPDSAKALQTARDLAAKARGGANFADLARQHSQDYGSGQNGGELGWTGRGGWVKPFEDAAFRAGVGQIVGPIRTQFGWHIIKVTGKDKREVKIATITMKVKASTQTIDYALKNAEDFAYLAKSEGFEKAAENSHLTVRESPEFTKGGVIPGIGMNDAAMSFAFKASVDDISQPIGVTGGVAVFMLTSVREDGLKPFEDVKALARTGAVRTKKFELVKPAAEELYAKVSSGGDLAAAAQGSPTVMVSRTGPFKPADMIPGIGRDPKFVGVVSSLKVGAVARPFEGTRGMYIVKLASAAGVDTVLFAAQKNSLRDQIVQEKRNALFTEWRTNLRDKAEIEDHRDFYYR